MNLTPSQTRKLGLAAAPRQEVMTADEYRQAVRSRWTEAQFMAEVVKLAKQNGWTPHHHYDSRRSSPGFPDLILRRGPGYAVRLIVAELKVGKNAATVEQYAWLGAFHASGVRAFLWTPADWDALAKELE